MYQGLLMPRRHLAEVQGRSLAVMGSAGENRPAVFDEVVIAVFVHSYGVAREKVLFASC